MLGVKTGADPVLVGRVLGDTDGACRVGFGDAEVALEPEVLKPAIRGRDLHPFHAATDRVLLWPYDPSGALRRTLPPLATRWIRRHRKRCSSAARLPWRPVVDPVPPRGRLLP
jgi:hypothetical protein